MHNHTSIDTNTSLATVQMWRFP